MAIKRTIGSACQTLSRSACTSGWIVSMPHFSVSGSTAVSTPACRIHSRARDGSGADRSFFISPQTRSADRVFNPSRSRAVARRASASGRPLPDQAKNRKNRRLRR